MIPEVFGIYRPLLRPSVAMHACNTNIQKAESGRSEVQGLPLVCSPLRSESYIKTKQIKSI